MIFSQPGREKPENWEPKSFGHASRTGKRIKRGLYQSAAGYLINADINGAANILKVRLVG
jgi:transposase